MDTSEMVLLPGARQFSRRQAVRLALGGGVAAGISLVGPSGAARGEVPGPDGPKPPRTVHANSVPASNGVDDTQAIQSLINVEGTEIVFRSGGTWMIDSSVALSPASNTRIILEEGATLRVIPNSNASYQLFSIGRDGPVQNVVIEGAGTILGDVDSHGGTEGEYGHLILVTNESKNVRIMGPLTIAKAWGDGIYVGGGTGSCRDIVVEGVTVDDCRREGIAPFWVDGCLIRDCHVTDIGRTKVTGPASGIDCEPNPGGQYARALTIENCTIERSAGIGILISENPGKITDLIVRGNTVRDCGRGYSGIHGELYKTNGIHVAGVEAPIVMNNVVESCGSLVDRSGASGQVVLRSCRNAVLKGGLVSNGLGRGIFAWACEAPEISDVTLRSNQGGGVAIYKSNFSLISNNRLLDNALSAEVDEDHMQINSSNSCSAVRNSFSGQSGRSWIRIQPSAKETLVAKNVGRGSAPAFELSNSGINTTEVVNCTIRADGIETPWGESPP